MTRVILDVRERDEYEQEHVKHSINVPLSVFTTVAPGILNQLKDKEIVLMCRSGARAAQALAQAQGLGYNDAHSYSVFPGGIVAWKEQGMEVQAAAKAPLPLMRQMQIIVGCLLVVFAALGAFVNQWFSVATIVFGGGLLMAGLTGNCAVASLLAKAPWNRTDPSLRKAYCQAAGNCE
ncbi:MAG: rhodanese-like domain-containing protein [Gammaproteobacteria bacterium]|nr:rhodanese-like domain-containing protein [Gammaproteobacteria bacterium]